MPVKKTKKKTTKTKIVIQKQNNTEGYICRNEEYG